MISSRVALPTYFLESRPGPGRTRPLDDLALRIPALSWILLLVLDLVLPIDPLPATVLPVIPLAIPFVDFHMRATYDLDLAVRMPPLPAMPWDVYIRTNP